MKTSQEQFLEALGFTDVRQFKTGGVIELYVGQTMKAAHKLLRTHRVRFPLIEKGTTPRANFEKFYAVQDRKVVGHLMVFGYPNYTIIQLENLPERRKQ